MQNKQQEFLKQREKLKYVIQNNVSKKILDPDIMIEQLISDKETFKFNIEPQYSYALPKWLKVQNNLVPAVYEQVWQVVKLGPSNQYCDTKIITQLFTTSGLPLEKLGYLWSLSNISSPGFLTQQELYVMLALIALVQTGYHVNDISIIKDINHPILPQLDYSFLNITVANPAINRNVAKNVHDPKITNSIIYNGVSNTPTLNSVPLRVKPIDELPDSNSSLKVNQLNLNSFPAQPLPNNNFFPQNIQPNLETSFNNLSINHGNFVDVRKSEIDVAFVMPEKKSAVEFDICLEGPTPELDVDFPIISSKYTENSNSTTTEIQKPNVNSVSIVTETKNSDVNADFKKFNDFSVPNYNFLNASEFSNWTVESRSSELPEFSENTVPADEDEFTDFQSATPATAEEYSDFQSASPFVKKYEFDNMINDNNFVSKFDHSPHDLKIDSLESGVVSDDFPSHSTSMEADKYDVFRTLMEPKIVEKGEVSENEDNDDGDGDGDDDEFGEFFTADVKPSQVKREMPIKEKCLDACLRILQEGVRIFSSISNEQTIKEVLCDERGYRYFNQLKIVYETSQRFQRPLENVHLNDALQSAWEKLSKYTKYIPCDELLDEIPSEEDVDASSCKLCETKCDLNCVRYAGNNYHVTCINLFLHFVEDSEITAMLNF